MDSSSGQFSLMVPTMFKTLPLDARTKKRRTPKVELLRAQAEIAGVELPSRLDVVDVRSAMISTTRVTRPLVCLSLRWSSPAWRAGGIAAPRERRNRAHVREYSECLVVVTQ